MPLSQAGLRVHVRHNVGSLALDVTFQTSAPWTVLFGASGSGKTTVLRAITGFLLPNEGQVVSEGGAAQSTVLFDAAHRICVPAHLRPIRTVGQRAALFPRLTVRQNVAYGSGSRPELVRDTLEHLRLESLAESPVGRLSGGEQQRVAIARAIAAARAAGPHTWLLLDEPFTGLDLKLRGELTRELREWLRELDLPVLSVTHDVAEVFALRADVVRLIDGRVVATGSPEIVLAEERQRVLTELTH